MDERDNKLMREIISDLRNDKWMRDNKWMREIIRG